VVVVGQTTQSPTMVVPANTNVHVNLTSTDVVHGFYVKEFNFSRFALPGVTNQFTFNAVKTGVYSGQCTQLCGLYHSLMFFKVKVVSPTTYDQWLLANRNVSAATAAANATALQNNTYLTSQSTHSKEK
jgi:cytochrome c oxidase subunit 2